MNEVEKFMHKNGITSGEDIDKIMVPLFGKHYLGVFEWNNPSDLPILKEGDVAILNRNVHWTGIYRKNGKLKEIDSYNRDLLGAKYADQEVPRGFLQPANEANCGQRTIALLIYEFYVSRK